MKKRSKKFVLPLCLVSLAVLCSYAQQFDLPGVSLSRLPALQVDGEGRAFVAAGRLLLRLNSELVPEQNITLGAGAVDISLNSGGERLVVCTEDSTCAVYSTDDLSAVSLVQQSALTPVVNSIALFTAGNSFYVGSYDPTARSGGGNGGILRLRQIDGLEGPSNFVQSTDYGVLTSSFGRDFFGGFVSGTNAYYIATDSSPQSTRGIKVMRVCHGTGCPGGSASCEFLALYEETIGTCGSGSFGSDDGVCGMSVVEDFAGTSGTSILVSRCRPGAPSSNVVCLVTVAEVDMIMSERFTKCSTEPDRSTLRSDLVWTSNLVQCSAIIVSSDT